MASVEVSPQGLPHPRELVWRPGFQERLGCPKSGHGCLGRHHGCFESSHGCSDGTELVLGLHQECPGVVKLVMEFHQVSQVDNQGEFRDGGASMWALSCEFQW